MEVDRHRAAIVQIALVVILLGLAIVSLGIGRYAVQPLTVLRILFASSDQAQDASHLDWSQAQWAVVKVVRIPRIVIAALSGMGLALCGATLQGILRNPLVGPEVAGVSHGAAFGGVVAIVLALPSLGIVGCAFLGGMTALLITFGLARLAGQTSILALVLAGVIVAAFFGAAVGMVQYLADPNTQLPSIVYWLLGSFAGATTAKIITVALPLTAAGSLLFMLRWRINLLSLGEADAQALGVKVGPLRWLIVALIAVIVAAQVAVSGGVGWIGLVMPHLGRMLVGPDHRVLLPVSALLGGIYLLAMDDIARTLGPQEIPIGLLTALIGTPVFALLFWRLQSKGWASE